MQRNNDFSFLQNFAHEKLKKREFCRICFEKMHFFVSAREKLRLKMFHSRRISVILYGCQYTII